MNSAIERLTALKVSDAMQRNVVRLSTHSTMAEAADTLLNHAISGAPVVDEFDHCVGVLSALDFVKREHELAESGALEATHSQSEPRPMLNVGVFDQERVERYMTPAVQSIAMDAPLMQAAKIMHSAHLHRIPVLDGRGRPIGMISSLDIVAALMTALEECGGSMSGVNTRGPLDLPLTSHSFRQVNRARRAFEASSDG